jgi:hypothetical protein
MDVMELRRRLIEDREDLGVDAVRCVIGSVE